MAGLVFCTHLREWGFNSTSWPQTAATATQPDVSGSIARSPFSLPYAALSALLVAGCAMTDSEEIGDLPNCVVPLGTSPARGPSDAWVTVVEFGDFQCPYCGRVQPTLAQLDAARPNMRWVWKHFPLTSSHSRALPAALAAECAFQQGAFFPMHDLLFAHQNALTDANLESYAAQLNLDLVTWRSCLNSSGAIERIDSDLRDGLAARVDGTPSFFINGKALVGSRPLGDFITAVDEAQQTALSSGSTQASYYSTREKQGCAEVSASP